MKHLFIFISLPLLFSAPVPAQEHNIHPVSYIFNPDADARYDIDLAVREAAAAHKLVCVIIGGDWSLWSRKLAETLNLPDIKKRVDEKYITVRVNFSPANRNEEQLNKYACPKNQGYPLIMILDEKGAELNIRDMDAFKIINNKFTGLDQQLLLTTLLSQACTQPAGAPHNN